MQLCKTNSGYKRCNFSNNIFRKCNFLKTNYLKSKLYVCIMYVTLFFCRTFNPEKLSTNCYMNIEYSSTVCLQMVH